MLLTKTVKIKWNKNQKQNYISKGYKYTKMGDEFEIKVDDLPVGNKSMVEVKCDYCGCIYTISYKDFNRYRNRCIIPKDACKNCIREKRKEGCLSKYGEESVFTVKEVHDKIVNSNLEKYGCSNPFANEQVKEKIKQTNLEKYGVNNAAKSSIVKEKIMQTNLSKYGTYAYTQTDEFKEKKKSTTLEKYGCEYYAQTDECKQKAKETSMAKYGVPHPMMSESVQNKKKVTNLKRYGVEYVLQNKTIRDKQIKTTLKRFKDNLYISSQQRQISEIIKDEFGNCELNHPFCGYLLDCYTVIDDCKIDVEYDGWHWHKNRQKEDEIRDTKCISENIKVLRIKGGAMMPTVQDLVDSIKELINNHDLYYKEIVLSDWGDPNK